MDEITNCANPAFVRYTWPGKDESYACAIHALELQGIANAMGLHLQLIPLTTKEMVEHVCSQKDLRTHEQID